MDKKLLSVLGTIGAALLASEPAIAQSAIAPYAMSARAVAKSEALLGTGSKLAALMAQQNGLALPAVQSAALPQAAVLRSPWSGQPITIQRPAVREGQPDVFGSTALPVDATPLDRRWSAVAARPADGGSMRWAASLRDRSEAERIDRVNRYVNGRISFVDDSRQFGRADVWQSASQSLQRGRGDCEDYAIAKLHLLRAAGFAEQDLFLVILKDLVRRSDHAVLAVRSGGRLLVLDNGTDRVTDSADIGDYRPIFTYSAGKRWTHGYRRTGEPPMVLASAPPLERNLPVPAAAPQEQPIAETRFEVTAADLAPSLLG